MCVGITDLTMTHVLAPEVTLTFKQMAGCCVGLTQGEVIYQNLSVVVGVKM